MTKTFKGGIVGGFDQLKAPDAPTISVTEGSTQLSVAFTNPSNVGGGAITSYTATAQDITAGTLTGVTSSTSPVTITGLTDGTNYSVSGLANNAFGSSPYSETTSSSPNSGLAMFFGGYSTPSSVNVNHIQKLNLTSSSNATDFGDLGAIGSYKSAVGTPTRCVAGGFDSTSGDVQLEYVNPASEGNSQDFGLLSLNNRNAGAFGNSTYGVFAPYNSGATRDFMRITIASLGNSSDVGDLSLEIYNFGGGISNGTIGLVFGGYDSQAGGTTDAISQKIIASSGVSTDFGNLTVARQMLQGSSNSTRGVMGGGGSTDTIDYVTIASASNATDFGNLTAVRERVASAASSTKAVFAGGQESSASVDKIDVITIASASNATDFGDLIAALDGVAGTGTRHGGIS